MKVGQVGVWSWEIAPDDCTWSPVAEHLLGAEPGTLPESLSRTLEFVHHDDRAAVRGALDELASGRREEASLELRVRHADGGQRWLRGSGRLQRKDERPERVVAALIDVTAERHAAEAAAQRQELDELVHDISTRFISMPVDAVDAGIVEALGDVGRMLGASRARLALVERERLRFVRQDAWGPDEEAGGPQSLDEVPWLHERLRTGEVLVIDAIDELPAHAREERSLLTRLGVSSAMLAPLVFDGDVEAVISFSKASPHRWPRELGAALRGLCEACVQALRRQQLEGDLRQAHRFLAHLIESSPIVMFRGPVGGDALDYVSPNIEGLFGHAPDWVAEHWPTLVHPDDLDVALDATDRAGRLGEAGYEARFRHRDGQWVRMLVDARAERDDTGAAVMLTGYALDVTDRRAAEERLAQAQKLEALGQLAGGIAHDFNNLLQVIHGYAELLAGTSSETAVNKILTASEQAKRLVDQLLTFSRQRAAVVASVDLNAMIVTITDMLTRILGPDVTVTRELAEELPPVTADPAQLEQVLVNLLVNARDAMPGGGTVRIATEVTTTPEPAEDRGTTSQPAAQERWVRLTVADTGIGMSDEVLEQLFDPFFTTKPEGRGTGLGLPIAYGAVTAAGGRIDVDSTPGQGTTFTIWLPTHDDAVTEAAHSDGRKPRRGGSILVVEDLPQLRTLVEATLSELGYDTIGANDAAEALELVAAGHDIDLLLTDVVMSGLKGPELAAAVRRTHPDLKVVYMSGYSSTGIEQDADTSFLQKPFSLAELDRVVQEVLEAPGR
jgi:PAS domain S-box-containing protein